MNDTLLGVLNGIGSGLQGFVNYQSQAGAGQVGGGVSSSSASAGIPVNVKADNSLMILVAVVAAIFLFKK